jgi:hypothetical protein
MLQGDKGAPDLIAAAPENTLELPTGDPAMETDIGRICACLTAFDRHDTKRQR